ncbi:MAG: GNAT family N-acetyltransferase [Methanobacteriota archaeon]
MNVRVMGRDELARIRDIDRTEDVRALHRSVGGRLVKESKRIDVQQWTEAQCASHIAWQEYELSHGGVLLGAFEGEEFLGLAVLGNRPVGGDPKTAQLVFLHVSRAQRRKGVASALVAECVRQARMRSRKRLYISATPSESAVGFYLSKGARLAEKPDPGLFAKEPEDIHMILDI